MRTLMHHTGSLRSCVFALATLLAASSLLACTGDDTNPPLPDSGPADGGSGDASKATDSSTRTDASTQTDSASPTDSAGQTG